MASIGERGIWHLRLRIRRLHVIGGSFAARLVVAGACGVPGIPCTFANRHGVTSSVQP